MVKKFQIFISKWKIWQKQGHAYELVLLHALDVALEKFTSFETTNIVKFKFIYSEKAFKFCEVSTLDLAVTI